jgi:glycosyltransferase involved in cell wall biosynthesis
MICAMQIRIAIVHEWLVTYAGSERVLEQMIECFPDADLFSVVDFIPTQQRGFLRGKQVTTSFIQRLPGARRYYRAYLPLMPMAIEQLDLSGYDLVISSTHAVAKGVLTGPDQLHLAYVYSPARYAWDLQNQYLRESGLDRGLKGLFARRMLHNFRTWDAASASRVDRFAAISRFIARRIEKSYRRDSVVVYPPVDIASFKPGSNRENFYVTASRMVPYKRIPMIVEAFSAMPQRRLVVIGDGPDFKKCQALASSNVTLMGWQPHAVLLQTLQKAKAFVFAAEEDFGIAPLEAQACGTPVIALDKGGARETIRGLDTSHPSGVFFADPTTIAIRNALDLFEREQARITNANCRDNAMRFSIERFRADFSAFVNGAYADWRARQS